MMRGYEAALVIGHYIINKETFGLEGELITSQVEEHVGSYAAGAKYNSSVSKALCGKAQQNVFLITILVPNLIVWTLDHFSISWNSEGVVVLQM